jgi:uncharacterized protein YbjT (DUF2867 family)
LRTVDAFGNSLDTVSIDQQVQISADLANGQDREQAFAYLVQIQLTSSPTAPDCKPFSILVTGATGFIGSRLIQSLISSGYAVKGLSRKQLPGNDKVKYVKADVFNFDELKNAMSGIETAFYLLHSMEGDKADWQEFASREKIQAQNFLRAATESGVKRIIYLGGLVNDSLDLSPHMRSRKEVGKILASGNIPVTEFRATKK